MKSIDLQGNLSEYFLDENRIIPKGHLKSVCKIYEKKNTCRYISLSSKGFICVKKTPMKKVLDKMSFEKKMIANSDNCEGLGNI